MSESQLDRLKLGEQSALRALKHLEHKMDSYLERHVSMNDPGRREVNEAWPHLERAYHAAREAREREERRIAGGAAP